MSRQEASARSRRSRTILLIAGGVLAVLVAAGCWVGVRAVLAAGELNELTPLTDTLRTAAGESDLNAVAAVSEDLQSHAAQAASLTGDPVWRVAEFVPWIGANLSAVRIASAQLDQLSTNAIVPLSHLARDFAASSESGADRIDVALMATAQEPLTRASSALATASAELATVDTSGLIPRLANGVEDLRAVVGSTRGVVSSLAEASEVVPQLMGGAGERTLLLMVQNNAELRTAGGITGTFIELHADDGELTITDQADSSAFSVRNAAIAPIPASLTMLYGDVTGRFVQDASIPADFALSAQLASAWWQDRTGVIPDAVIAIDPIVLQSLVALVGEVPLADGTVLTADTMVQQLLVDPYLTLDSEQQTALFTDATSAMFTKLLGGSIDPLAWVQALMVPIEQGRVSVWSADAATQSILEAGPLGGPAARQRLAGDDAYAVYFNDATGGKLDSFMTTAITSGVSDCRADGRREVVVTVTLSSAVPADVEERFPRSMTGGGQYGVAVGDIGMVVTVSAPVGTFPGGVRKDGELMAATDGEDAGFPVSLARVNLQPGETNTLEFRFLTDQRTDFAPVLLHTPLLTAPTIESAVASCS